MAKLQRVGTQLIYVLDTSTISQAYKSFYRDRFPTFWQHFHSLVTNGLICSVSEVEAELNNGTDVQWAVPELKGLNPDFFAIPTEAEQSFLSRIFRVPTFHNNISLKSRKTGTPVADPFLVAKAGASLVDSIVVTEEAPRRNSVKVPDICHHFSVQCTNLQGLMQREGWQF